jgi:hypothetical protein
MAVLNPHYVKIGVIPIHKNHVRIFLAYGGAILMLADMTWAIVGPWACHTLHLQFEGLEPTFTLSGKCGAAMNGLVLIFEKFFRS